MNSLKPSFSLTKLPSSFLNSNPSLLTLHRPLPPSKPLLRPISATIIRPNQKQQKQQQQQQQQQLYQPFRPPPSPLPEKFRNLDAPARLETLGNRLGLWFEYAPLIPSLYQEGFSIPFLEETTGISGVEQNRLVVAAQVRDSLIQSNTEPEIVASFDQGGAELLYEIRLLSASQRAAAARYIVEKGFDGKGAQDLARAMKDFPRRRGDYGWECFDYNLPGDCLAFLFYRQSREHKSPSEQRTSGMRQALEAAESERAKAEILRDIEGRGSGKEGKEEVVVSIRIPVVRLKVGEVAGATNIVVLPVCRAEEKEKEILEAPWKCETEGLFGVVVSDKGWKRWVVLPGWEPVMGLGKGGVVVAFSDGRVLPWKVNRWYKYEPILVLADRETKEVQVDDGFYLVTVDGGVGLKVERGSALKERGVTESLGNVVMVVRPPKEENDDQLSDEDWE